MFTTLQQTMRGSLRLLWRARLRSSLAVACGALGVAGVIVSVSFASGGRAQVLDQIRRMGTNIVMVTAQPNRARAGRARTGSIVTTLRDADYAALRREVPDVVRSSALVSTSLRLKAEGLSKVSPVVGCEPDYFAIKSWPLDRGEVFDAADLRRFARVALLGRTVASDLFGADSPLGQRLFINRVPFEVVGVLAERGQGLDVVNEDEQVYVPLTTAMRRLMSVEYFNAITFEIARWELMDRSAAAMAGQMRIRHRRAAREPEDFQVKTQQELVGTQLASSARLTFYVRWIGWSGLLVSDLGILALAWIAVRDRTAEIGTRRALGATAWLIFFQFAFEATTVAALGSTIGLGLAWFGSQLAAARGGVPFVFDASSAAGALGSALVLNLVCSIWPASRAARLDPIASLRHE
jgi:putative ABC transport system permease protein